ncbi:MAG: PAS domain S-box protein, partial [Oscillibacter sp.]|nr:PAS domain S-box protein [Oscillibacter sp.]
MYHCHIHFYFLGAHSKVFEIIQEMPALEHFTHSFSWSLQPDLAQAARADVIVAGLRGADAEQTLSALLAARKEGAELLLLSDRKTAARCLSQSAGEIRDLWTLPMPEAEVRFRFRKWQEGVRRDRELWQTSQFLDATIDSVPNLVWYKDKNGVHEKVNDSFCRTVNKTKAQVQGQRHAYIWDVEYDDPACIESERVVMERKETVVSEETVKTGEGNRLLTTYKSPLYNLDGTVMGTVGVGIDVTQERAYEQELMQKNRTLEMMFTNMECGVICHTLDGSRILSINRAALSILGYGSEDELMADGFNMVAESVVEEDKPGLRESIQSLSKEGDSVSVEYRVRHRDGEILHVMGNVKLIRENGELFYQRFLLDYTARKRQETQERMEAERRQMELVQALTVDYELVCFFDLDSNEGYPLEISEQKRELLGSIFSHEHSYDESIALYTEKYVYPEDQEIMRQVLSRDRLKQELQEKKMSYMNYRLVRNGEMKFYQMKVVRAGRWEGRHTIVMGVRSVDDEIRNEMEQKGILEDALLQANQASKAKTTFLSNMSHDIRTPMNAIVGFTALALTHIDRQEQVEECLKKIMASGNHLLSLINDILDMSRIESGKMRLEETPCSLPDVLHSLRSMVQADIHAKQLELFIDAVDVMDEEIFCDKLRLNQVLLNLLSNAVKYTPAGGTISIRVAEKTGAPMGSGRYEFRVKDTGIGMSEEFVRHIFEPFERERNYTISGIQGTGLGMAITKNIVDMMNGTIEVKSEQGVGTEFTVSFLFRLHAGDREPLTIPELKNCRALVVDDDFNTCDSVIYMLQQIGLRAEWTLSGKEAVLRTHQAIMREDNYSVYIIDWLLPDMNGIEITRRIRKEMGDDVPVIVLTAYDWSDIEEEALQAGVTAFCSKPIFLSELRKVLEAPFAVLDE